MTLSTEPEIRCDFQVTEKRKKIWQVELDLIQKFQALCEQHSLSYFASNGTLLGAVRHQGFIPWDDDVDLVMPRKDYDRFVAVAKETLKAPYFLHCSEADTGFFKDFVRLMNLDTTALTMRDWDIDTKKGIFIDIFPLDARPDEDPVWERYKVVMYRYREMLNMTTYYHFYKENSYRKHMYQAGRLFCRFFGRQRLQDLFEKKRRQYADTPTEKVFQITHGNKCKEYPRRWFSSYEEVPFEDLSLRIPCGYDEILKLHYGDYMEFPEPDKRGLHHSIYFDPDRPYTEYKGKLTQEEARATMKDI